MAVSAVAEVAALQRQMAPGRPRHDCTLNSLLISL